MNQYNPNKHHRRSIRLKGYDYSQAGLYFITICCQDRAHLFGEVINGEMHLNAFGKIALKEWLATEKIRDNCKIHESIVMPNHLHGIIEITFKKGNDNTVGDELQFAHTNKPFVPTDKPSAPTETKFDSTALFKSPSQTIGSIIRGFKIATIKKIKENIVEGELGELQFAPTASTSLEEFNRGEFGFVPAAEIIRSLDFKIWQRNYYEHIIRDEQAYYRISQYIISNPKKWTEDKFCKL